MILYFLFFRIVYIESITLVFCQSNLINLPQLLYLEYRNIISVRLHFAYVVQFIKYVIKSVTVRMLLLYALSTYQSCITFPYILEENKFSFFPVENPPKTYWMALFSKKAQADPVSTNSSKQINYQDMLSPFENF